MRTYDPADRILYVHLAQEPAAPVPRADDGCQRLPVGYANASPGTRLPAPDGRPALVLLPGGSAESSPSPPSLRLAR